MTTISEEAVTTLPKVLLHDHLDGGLRPSTLIELAEHANYTQLPDLDPAVLAAVIHVRSHSGSLTDYLSNFTHTVAVTQTSTALQRVAREAVEDLAADNVVYAELRYAPELHTTQGLTPGEVIGAVSDGLRQGMKNAARKNQPIVVKQIVTAMRHANQWGSIAGAATRHRHQGVVAFDIAGAEAGNPAARFADACTRIRATNMHVTIHAGEETPATEISDAVVLCGAERLGHAVSLADHITTQGDLTTVDRIAAYVRDRRICVEACPTSNVGTGAVADLASHPFDLMYRAGFRVTVNTDNRLMSNTTTSKEILAVANTFDYTVDDVARFTLNAAKAAFAGYDYRRHLIRDILTPAYRAAGTKFV